MNTTDGNLSVHARKLEEAGYIACTKFFEGRLPKTEYKLTASGRRALENYLSHMEKLIQQMRANLRLYFLPGYFAIQRALSRAILRYRYCRRRVGRTAVRPFSFQKWPKSSARRSKELAH